MIHRYTLNNQIREAEVRVIDDQDANLGVMKTSDALKMAYDKGLDLVIITAQSIPPVAKIVSFDKFRYQQEKEQKKTKQKAQELKQIRFSARSAQHDMETQAKKINQFIAKGDRVEIILRLRGREKGNKEWAQQRMNLFLTLIETEYKVVSPAKFAGMGMIIQLAPK